MCVGRGCRTPLPLSKETKKKIEPKTAALLQSRMNLPQASGLMACLERQIAALPQRSPPCPLPFPRESSCPARGCACGGKSAPSLRHKSRCVYGLASTRSLGMCFDIQLQERVPPPSWFCTQSALLPLGTRPYRQRTNSRQLLKQNSLLRWLLKLGIDCLFFFFFLCRQRHLAENILRM